MPPKPSRGSRDDLPHTHCAGIAWPCDAIQALDALELAKRGAVTEPSEAKRSCNRHIDCGAAEARALAAGRRWPDHCHDDCCEDCFGE